MSSPEQLTNRAGVVVFDGTAAPGGGSQTFTAPGMMFCAGTLGELGAVRVADSFGDVGLGPDASWDTGKDLLAIWYVPQPTTVAAFYWQTYPAFGTPDGLYRFGLYRADQATLQPTALVWQSAEQDGTSAGLKTDAAAVDLAAGVYLSAFCFDADALNGPLYMATATSHGEPPVGLPDFGILPLPTDMTSGDPNPRPISFTRTRAYGAFPNPGGNWNVVLASSVTVAAFAYLVPPLMATLA